MMEANFYLELIEARNLPASRRGGRPDPIFTISCPRKPEAVVRTQIMTANCNPVFNQKFVFEHCAEIEDLELTYYDREVNTHGFVGKVCFQLGGPSRMVGSRYFNIPVVAPAVDGVEQLTTTNSADQPAVHLVWRTEMVEAKPEKEDEYEEFSIAALRGSTKPATSVDASPIKKESDESNKEALGSIATAGGGLPQQPSSEIAQAQAVHNAAFQQEVLDSLVKLTKTVRGLEANMNTFQDKVEAKLAHVDSRILEIETVLSIRNVMKSTTTEAMLQHETDAIDRHRALRASSDQGNTSVHGMPGVTSPSKSTGTKNAIKEAEGDTANQLINIPGEVNAIGALKSIQAHPTKVSAQDQQLLANYTYHQVATPGVPTAGIDRPAHRERIDDNLERRIEVSTMGLEAHVREVTSTQ